MFKRILNGTVYSRGKEAIWLLSNRLISEPLATPFLQARTIIVRPQHRPVIRNEFPMTKSPFNAVFITHTRGFSSGSVRYEEECFAMPFIFMLLLGLLVLSYQIREENLPHIVNVGDPILQQPAQEVNPEQIGSERIQNTIDNMVKVMRKEHVASLSAPLIGVPLKIIVLEDTKLYMAPSLNEVNEKQDRHPSGLLVIVNPKLRITDYQTTKFFEGCVSVNGHLAMVKRFLKVEVTGLDRNGQLIKVDASGRQARILQHEYHHLEGIFFSDKLAKRY